MYNQPEIVILDRVTLSVVHTIPAHHGRILSLAFDFAFKRLVSLGKDKTLRIWDFTKLIKI